MKLTSTTLLAGFAGFALLAMAAPVFAADKEVTITGDAKCAKCALHEADKCQTVIQVDEQGKKLTYYLVANDVSKPFHENVCEATKKATATGTVTKKGDKLEFTATKIELVK